jgi:hypothetical protein
MNDASIPGDPEIWPNWVYILLLKTIVKVGCSTFKNTSVPIHGLGNTTCFLDLMVFRGSGIRAQNEQE